MLLKIFAVKSPLTQLEILALKIGSHDRAFASVVVCTGVSSFFSFILEEAEISELSVQEHIKTVKCGS